VFNREGLNHLGKSDYSFLRNGDLVLRRGRSVESYAVYLLDKNRDYSHIGIVYIEDNIPYIIHVIPDKPAIVRKDSPEEFLSAHNASLYKIIRADFTAQKLAEVAETANAFYAQKLTFDNNYDLSTDNSLYCTELVLKAFGRCNIRFPEILPQKIKLLFGTYSVIMPGSFLENSHFTGIIR
jgi:hypothetical protein